jgi:hypothetical protein
MSKAKRDVSCLGWERWMVSGREMEFLRDFIIESLNESEDAESDLVRKLVAIIFPPVSHEPEPPLPTGAPHD